VRLSPADADLFYRLMWRLQFYVNQQHQVIRDVGSIAGYAVLSTAEKMPVRDVLWENPRLIGAYAAKNPDGLSTEELEIVRRWKRFVAGTFYIVRYLKKHTILLGDGDVYGVLALNQSLEELLPGRPLPIAVKAVLLPFKGIVIYDGLLSSYHITLGRGIGSTFREEYLRAKQNGRIIVTLEPKLARPIRRTSGRTRKDWGPVVDDLVKTTEKVKGGPAVQSAALSLLRASAKLAQAAVNDADDLDGLWKMERRMRTALSRFQTVLGRAG